MEINLKFTKDFEKALNALVDESGEDLQILNGINDSQTNFSDFIDSFVDKNVNDVTIDNNANASHKDIASLLTEKGKPIDKLIVMNKIFFEMKKKYGLTTAREWLRSEYLGAFYLHDFSSASFKPYCFAYDLTRLAKEGLFFLSDYNNQGPQHLTTFLDDVIEYISFMSNRSSGAVGIPNILIWTYYFYQKDVKSGHVIKDKDYYLKQCFQKFIYRLNQPFMRIDQSAFVNVSIFDREYYMALFGDLIFPDGTLAVDCIEEFMEHQKTFMEVVSQVRSENMFTFPVLSFSLLYQDGKFVNEEFARWCSDHNTEWNDSNFFVGKDVTTLSNCCRLLSQTNKLKGFMNSIGGTELRIGSVKVNTINLVHIVYELTEDEGLTETKYLNLLKKRVLLCCKTLDIIRTIIKRNIEKGLLPNYCDGGIGLEQQYCTVGILGLYEVVDKFGYVITDEFGNKSYSEKGIELASKIFKTINDIKDNFERVIEFSIENKRYRVPATQSVRVTDSENKKKEELFGVVWDKRDMYDISESELKKFIIQG